MINQQYIGFENFTDKVRVFNKDLASDIVDQEYFELLADKEIKRSKLKEVN